MDSINNETQSRELNIYAMINKAIAEENWKTTKCLAQEWLANHPEDQIIKSVIENLNKEEKWFKFNVIHLRMDSGLSPGRESRRP